MSEVVRHRKPQKPSPSVSIPHAVSSSMVLSDLVSSGCQASASALQLSASRDSSCKGRRSLKSSGSAKRSMSSTTKSELRLRIEKLEEDLRTNIEVRNQLVTQVTEILQRNEELVRAVQGLQKQMEVNRKLTESQQQETARLLHRLYNETK